MYEETFKVRTLILILTAIMIVIALIVFALNTLFFSEAVEDLRTVLISVKAGSHPDQLVYPFAKVRNYENSRVTPWFIMTADDLVVYNEARVLIESLSKKKENDLLLLQPTSPE